MSGSGKCYTEIHTNTRAHTLTHKGKLCVSSYLCFQGTGHPSVMTFPTAEAEPRSQFGMAIQHEPATKLAVTRPSRTDKSFREHVYPQRGSLALVGDPTGDHGSCPSWHANPRRNISLLLQSFLE